MFKSVLSGCMVGNVTYEGLGLGSCDVESNYITNLSSFKSLYKFCVKFDFHTFVQKSDEFFVIKIFLILKQMKHCF